MTNKPPQTVSEREEIARTIYAHVHHIMRVTGKQAQGAYESAADAIIALQAEGRRELVESLAKLALDAASYGDHDGDCFANGYPVAPCSCGYTATNAKLLEMVEGLSALSKVVSGGGSSRDLSRSVGDPLEVAG